MWIIQIGQRSFSGSVSLLRQQIQEKGGGGGGMTKGKRGEIKRWEMGKSEGAEKGGEREDQWEGGSGERAKKVRAEGGGRGGEAGR